MSVDCARDFPAVTDLFCTRDLAQLISYDRPVIRVNPTQL